MARDPQERHIPMTPQKPPELTVIIKRGDAVLDECVMGDYGEYVLTVHDGKAKYGQRFKYQVEK